MIVAPPAAALTVSPTRIQLSASASADVRVRNPAAGSTVVDASPASFALALDGRPRLLRARDTRVRLVVRPRTLPLRAGAAGMVAVSARVLPGARPGDHPALLLLATRAARRGRVGVRVQVGVVVVVRVPGAVVHRLQLRRLVVVRLRRRTFLVVTLWNRGNVVEAIAPRMLDVVLRGGAAAGLRLDAPRRELLPGARGVVRFALPSRLHGRTRAVVELRRRDGLVERRSRRIRLP